MKNKKIKRIAYLTGTRADFGLMTPVLEAIKKEKVFKLQIFAAGMHLMPKFGFTVKEVEKVFPGTVRLKAVFSSDDKLDMGDFIGALVPRLFKAFAKHRPDILLLLGDRIEMLSAAIAATYLGIPLAHIHGGDKTTTVDDAARHAITKLSHIHFVATKNSVTHVKKLGEDKKRIFLVGAPAIDMIKKTRLFTRREICLKLNLNPDKRFFLVMQHPVSEKIGSSGRQMREMLEAVKSFNLPVVVIYPNADPGSAAMIKEIERERKNPQFRIFKSLLYKNFLSLEKEAVVWIGNSSAGVIESALFKIPVVNVGKRQYGRPHGANVLDVGYERKEIIRAIDQCLFDKNFINQIKKTKNLWGDGRAAGRILAILKKIKINKDFFKK